MTGERRCKVTGNPSGTDMWALPYGACRCDECQAYRITMARAIFILRTAGMAGASLATPRDEGAMSLHEHNGYCGGCGANIGLLFTEAQEILDKRNEERAADRAAIRAYKRQHDEFPPESREEGEPCQCLICREHAAAIQRAQDAKG